ncbi:MAG: hypothetical protein AAF958_11495 [Planctomycetota bacterium]
MAGSLLLVGLVAAGFFTLRRESSAQSIAFLPTFVTNFLDRYPDGRTLIMSIMIAGVPGIVMANELLTTPRRLCMTFVIVVLVLFEASQLWIPTRHFSISDLAFSVIGVVVVEVAVMAYLEFIDGHFQNKGI